MIETPGDLQIHLDASVIDYASRENYRSVVRPHPVVRRVLPGGFRFCSSVMDVLLVSGTHRLLTSAISN